MLNHYPYNQHIFTGITNPATAPAVITAVARVQSGLPFPQFIIGGKGGGGGATYALMKKASTYSLNIWKSPRIIVDGPFNITEIILPLTIDLNVNHVIQPILDFDNGAKIVYGTEINNTNFDSGSNSITLTPECFDYDVHGENNVCLQLNFTGSSLIGVTLPIRITVDTESVV